MMENIFVLIVESLFARATSTAAAVGQQTGVNIMRIDLHMIILLGYDFFHIRFQVSSLTDIVAKRSNSTQPQFSLLRIHHNDVHIVLYIQCCQFIHYVANISFALRGGYSNNFLNGLFQTNAGCFECLIYSGYSN